MTVPDPAAAKPRHVLYVDDDPGLCRLVEKDLQRNGFTVQIANSGTDALRMAAACRYDAIALDHFMPGQDGLATLAQLRELPDLPPVVYVTAAEEGRIAIAALKAGASDYVIKDAQGAFLTLLRTALEQAAGKAELLQEKARAEREIRASRDRAELLLREVNHRVANSLQLIASLVTMQGTAARHEETRDVLRTMQNRILAVMQVHRRLYSDSSVGTVEVEPYLRGLAEELEGAVAAEGRPHPLELQIDPIRISTDQAVSVGVIVTELITNAYKYAYSDGARGAIRIVLRRVAPGHVALTVEDDGKGGFSEAVRGTGLGTKIVHAMSASLGSKLQVDPDHAGTRITITFDVDEADDDATRRESSAA